MCGKRYTNSAVCFGPLQGVHSFHWGPLAPFFQMDFKVSHVTSKKLKKLIIQIPCFNEEDSLAETLSELPRQVSGVDSVEWLIIDDGSTDQTVEVAKRCGVDHIVRLPENRGLARAFSVGLEACIRRGADVIVNTDADNQYVASDIPKLVAPIVEGRADMVIGERPIMQTDDFSLIKKLLQKWGSWAVRMASRTRVPDAPSGFRAFSRTAAMRLNVFSAYTYTLETIIQAGQKGMFVESVPIRTNPKTRNSRLVRSISSYVWRSITTIVRIFMTYRPFRFFVFPGLISFLAGFSLGLRFTIYFILGQGSGKVQSLILAAVLMLIGFFLCVTGFVADLVAVNRKLLEETNRRLWLLEDKIDKLNE